MSHAAALLTELAARGVSVRAKGPDTLGVTPAEALTPEIRARLIEAKLELLRLLARPAPVLASLAVREVLGFRAAWLVDLPLPTVLVLELPDVAGMVHVDLSKPARVGAFDAAEWLVMARAAESERARAADLRTWAERKRSTPRWRLTDGDATGGPVYGSLAPSWTAGRVLGHLGATLRAVAIHGEGDKALAHLDANSVARGDQAGQESP